ncbi:hypothetical protein [Virgibacillus sp. JSM 102003]|uniref:hypothetical protein n=1 Tax=Virgibacillus sp. JSM 102003 TaxID=1562108 RepID=UPI0035C20B76
MAEHGFPCKTYELSRNQFDLDSYLQVAKELHEKYPDIKSVFSVDLVLIACLKEAMKKE